MPPTRKKLFTIGYQGRSLEEYIELLKNSGVKALCDVRKDPVSRKPGFSRKRLKAACEAAGIDYFHFPDLGIPKEERKKIGNEEERQELLDRYEKELLPEGKASLEQLKELLKSHRSIAFTCYEADPEKCHRLRVLRKLEEESGQELAFEHL